MGEPSGQGVGGCWGLGLGNGLRVGSGHQTSLGAPPCPMSHPKGTWPGRSLGTDYSPGLGVSYLPRSPPWLPQAFWSPSPSHQLACSSPSLNAGPWGLLRPCGSGNEDWVWGTDGAGWCPGVHCGEDRPGYIWELDLDQVKRGIEGCPSLWLVIINNISGTSLVVQGLRIRLAMQEPGFDPWLEN